MASNQSSFPLISIIIPTYNEQAHIQDCLNSLKKQIYPKLEFILIDDGSTDNTLAILKKQTKINLLTQKHQGPGRARNKGAQHAKGKILVFVDADMIFDPHFISQLTKPIRQGKTIGTFSKQEFVANMSNPWARSWSLIRGFPDGHMHPLNFPDKQPVFRAILKSEFDKVGGFDPNRGYDDDWSLAEKLGMLATNAPKAKFYHFNPETPSEIFFQAKWMGTRRYKLGLVGKLWNIIKITSPIDLIRVTLYTITLRLPQLIIAKFIYMYALTFGIISTLIGKRTK